ncbi:DUF2267 domain-containing protein [Nisaea nitritireducens]|uniref:DUF2267 domain-containing protein n=1 Tax=Nisaea nitritireducens TaxID=568392 RepID=UPI0018691075|nr:DUF2267 domain-containing protein [Nisaea nitritireducens]
MTSGLATFDTTVQESHGWLKAIMESLHTDDRQVAYQFLRATLHALRDRVGPENAVHFGAQLPMLLRGLLFEGWHMAGTPTAEDKKQEFLERVRAQLPAVLAGEAERGVQAVFEVICDKVDAGEARKLVRVLPTDLRSLWPTRATQD